MNPVVVVHGGGASNISKDRKERVRQGIVKAATAGYKILKQGGSAVDAVEEAVTTLEDDSEFNAGCGSVLNINGDVEMDASIMDGKDLSAGAVSAVRCIANPIRLARNLGTVGAVALDCRGNLAFATSTGGIVNKMVGRVGDTPCIGSGGYADNDIGAISTTGHGESILKVNLARLTLFHLEQGKTLEEAAELSLGYMKSRLKGLGGLILISKTGDWVVKWTSASMPWAAAKDDKLHSGIDVDETTTTDLP
uniref:Isoaspartyl peptidase/L-asparaginase n=1 Tax=Propithecus coquereli TaxID=379532 RepID=A0A2K6GZV3_PROCO